MKFLLVEDHPIFRFGVRQLILQRWPDAEVVEAGSLAEALHSARAMQEGIAVVDLNLPDCNGLEILTQFQRAVPSVRVLVLSFNPEAAYATRALQSGAMGYLAKDLASQELIAALDRIASGGRYITRALAEQLADQLTGKHSAELHEALSEQEYRVMISLAKGRRVSGIALEMHLSPKTVSTYRARILEKLGVTSNAEIASYCLTHRLIEPGL